MFLINPYTYSVVTPFSNTLSTTFDGVDDYVAIGNPTELQITGALSISFWYKSSSSTDQFAVGKDGLGTFRSFAVWTNSYGAPQTINFYIFSSGAITQVFSSSNYNDGNWHNVNCIFIPSTSLSIYVDGVLDGTNTTSIPSTIDNTTGNFDLGSLVSSGSPLFPFNGNLDEVAVWNTDQTSNVSTIYNSGTPQDLTSLSPVAWWRNGDGDTYATLTDHGSGGNDGTMTNMTSGDIVLDVP